MSFRLNSDGGDEEARQLLLESVRLVPNFPKPGLQFKDLSHLLASPVAFQAVVDALVTRYKSRNVTGADSPLNKKICATVHSASLILAPAHFRPSYPFSPHICLALYLLSVRVPSGHLPAVFFGAASSQRAMQNLYRYQRASSRQNNLSHARTTSFRASSLICSSRKPRRPALRLYLFQPSGGSIRGFAHSQANLVQIGV